MDKFFNDRLERDPDNLLPKEVEEVLEMYKNHTAQEVSAKCLVTERVVMVLAKRHGVKKNDKVHENSVKSHDKKRTKEIELTYMDKQLILVMYQFHPWHKVCERHNITRSLLMKLHKQAGNNKIKKTPAIDLRDEFSKTYSELAKHTPKVEGEVIQELYFMFKTWKLDEEMCDKHEGTLIPQLEDLEDMQDAMTELFNRRHRYVNK